MGKDQVQEVRVHAVPIQDHPAVMEEIVSWQMRVIRRRLEESGLSRREQLAAVDAMIRSLSPAPPGR